jgi:hypothetical protein
VFAVVRHPDIEALGVCPEGALEMQRARGWVRVSPWAVAPADLYLPDYAGAFDDLDAESELKPKAVKAKKIDSDEEQRA